MPSEHDGENTFSFRIRFSEEPAIGYAKMGDDVLSVANGDVKRAQRTTAGSNEAWDITVEPDGADDVTITLPETTDCNATGAVCSKGDDPKKLSNSVSATVAGRRKKRKR